MSDGSEKSYKSVSSGASSGSKKSPIPEEKSSGSVKQFTKRISDDDKKTYYDFQREEFQKKGLFKTMLTLDSKKDLVERKELEVPSILIKSFGMRNLKSLQDALDLQKRLELEELYRRQQREEEQRAMEIASGAAEDKSTETTTQYSSMTRSPSTSVFSVTSSTETDGMYKEPKEVEMHLRYLMGLDLMQEEEEEQGEEKEEPTSTKPSFIFSTSASMKHAQKYLKYHRIFDFFQFLIAHLLASASENPVVFILELLNKCLMYRSSLGLPPLLYEKKHIEQMFYLMDRLKCGSITMEQYEKAMNTFGICEYNKTPMVNEEEMVEKEVFVEEVYRAELELFDDMIKCKRFAKKKREMPEMPMPQTSVSTSTYSGGYLMPPDFFIRKKDMQKSQLAVMDGILAGEQGFEE